MTLKWDEKYEVGHDRIDTEHRIFLDLIIDFQQAIEQNLPKAKQLRILKEVEKYAEFHFVSEENIMLDISYPDYEHHAKLHAYLLSEVQNEYFKFMSDQTEGKDIFEFLFNWFAIHTSNEDKKLVEFIKQ